MSGSIKSVFQPPRASSFNDLISSLQSGIPQEASQLVADHTRSQRAALMTILWRTSPFSLLGKTPGVSHTLHEMVLGAEEPPTLECCPARCRERFPPPVCPRSGCRTGAFPRPFARTCRASGIHR